MKKTPSPLANLPRAERARFTKQLRSLARVRVLTADEVAKIVGGGGPGYDDDPHSAYAGH